MSDFERFFKELDRRMDMPDESIDDYLARLAEQRRRSPSIENRDRTDAIVIEDSPPEEATSNKGSNVEIPIDNGTTSRVALPTNNEPIFEITSSKRKVVTNELELSERKDKRIKLSPEPPSCTTSNYNKIAQNPSAQQQGSTSRQGRADLKIETSKSIPNRHEVRKTPEPGRHITSKESPAPGKTEQPPSNIDNAGTADIVRNRPQPSHSNEKKRAINDSPVLAPKEPKEPVITKKLSVKTAKPASTKQRGKKVESKEGSTSNKYLPHNDPKTSARMSPGAYAERVNGQVRMSETYLNGTRIYFFGGDRELATVSTKAKMFRLARCGATLVPEYNPDIVTHIVIDDNIVSLHHLLENISVKRLSKVPGHIPILKWPWATTDNTKKHFRIHAAFATRRNSVDAIDYDPDINPIVPSAPKKGKEHAAPNPEVANSSGEQMVGNSSAKSPREASSSSSRGLEDEEAPFEKQRVSSKPRANSDPANENNVGEDPLAEFYAQARTERDQEVQENLGDGNKATNLHAENGKKSHSSGSRFLCDGVRTSAGQCPNQDVIDKLSELKKIHEQRLMTGDNFRVLKYSTAINALRAYPKRIRSTEEAMSLNGVAKKTAEKIMEIIRTGDLQRLHHERAVSDDIRVIELFQGIYGVGRQIAHKWYNAGCRTLDDLREGKGGVKPSSVQQIGLQYYDDINSRMPRAEAEEIFNKIKPFALKIDPKLYVDIMGSFRRGKADCGDIDIIITRPTDDGRNHSGALSKLLKDLRIAGIITEDLSIPDDWSELELCYRGLCRKDSDSRRRRIDFLVIPWESRGAALLYYTGDGIFNRSMRLKANKMGYSLNQKGLFAGVVRDPQDRTRKLNQGTNIASATEREIFDKLGVPWQEPHERVRGFS